jgi:hypothetical protein
LSVLLLLLLAFPAHTTAFVTVVPDEPSFLVVEKVATRVTQVAQRHVVA